MGGSVIVLSGASSVGKGGIKKRLLEDGDLNLLFAVSMTTRPKKDKEVDGVDYYFTDISSFARAVKERQLYEYTEFNGYYYGTPKSQVDFLLSQNKNVLVCVDAQGAGDIKLKIPESICFFIVPNSMAELERAIQDKYRDDTASINLRINKAKMELEISSLYNNLIVNSDEDLAFKQIKEIILKEWAKKGE